MTSTWRYQVTRQVMPDGVLTYEIREVYDGGLSWTEDEIAPAAGTLEDLKWQLEKMLEAVEKGDVLDIPAWEVKEE